MRTRWAACAVSICALVVVGCARPVDEVSPRDTSGAPTVAPTDSTIAPTTALTDPAGSIDTSTTVAAAPTTTPSGTATSPPTTTTEPAPAADLTLSFDGVAPYRFGDRDSDVVAGMIGLLGEPVSEASEAYPVATEGEFLDETEEVSFAAPFGRTVCFVSELCLQFGGGAPSSIIFTGWRLRAADEPRLETENGIAIGSRWADHLDEFEIEQGGCYQIGYGAAGGIRLLVESSGDLFGAAADDGTPIVGDPDPADVSVVQMEAGDLPIFLFADC